MKIMDRRSRYKNNSILPYGGCPPYGMSGRYVATVASDLPRYHYTSCREGALQMVVVWGRSEIYWVGLQGDEGKTS